MANTSKQETQMTLSFEDYKYEFNLASPLQKMLIPGILTKHTNLETAKITFANGNTIDCTARTGGRFIKLTLSYKSKPDIEIFASTLEDLDMITIMLRSAAKGCSGVSQEKMINNKWSHRDEACLFRKDSVDFIRKLSKEELTTLIKLQETYGTYLEKLLCLPRSVLLANLNLL